MKLLSYLRWGSAELLFTISILCSVFFGAYALPVQLANDISTTQLSILSGIFFVVFAISQLYSGYLINRVSTKVLIGFSAILASFGLFLFANTHVFSLLIIARIIIGLGLGCTFVGVLYIVEQEFKSQFALFASLSQSISNIAAGIVAIFGSSLINKYSYQSTYNLIGALLLVTSLFVFVFLPGKAKTVNNHEQESFIQNVTKITTNSRFLAATVYFGGIFSVILTYVDLFNVKYREVVFHMSPTKAVILNGTIPLGVALGSIIAGTLSAKFQCNRLIAFWFGLLVLLVMIVTLYVRYPANYSYQIDLTCQILFGIGCGGGMLAFQEIQVEFKKPHLRSLANSMVLTVSYLFAGIILQPIIGMIIGTTSFKLPRNTVITSHNLLDQPVVQHAWHHYNIGLLLLVVILGFSFISSLFFTKKITN